MSRPDQTGAIRHFPTSCQDALHALRFCKPEGRRSSDGAGVADERHGPGRVDRRVAGQEALPVADRPGGAVAGVRRDRAARADRVGRLAVDRPDRDPGVVPRDRPGRRSRPLQPAGRRDRGAGAGPLLPLDHLPVPADAVRRVRRRVLGDRARRPVARSTGSAWRSRSASSAGSASTPRTSSATRRRATSAGCPRSRWRRASTGTSTSSTTAATTSASRPRRTRRAAGWARASTRSGRAPCSARCGSAWRLEKRRYARRKQHPFRLGNDVLNAWLMSAVLWGAMVAWLGVGILPYLVVQAVVGFSLLEVVNYIEHYGMLRQRVGAPGRERYERVLPSHSWNSNNIATNVLLYHLQRHSDHHANPTRRYQTLRDFEESPVLPTGYAGMILLALRPAGVAPGHGPARAGPLRRRPEPGQHRSPRSASGCSRRYAAPGAAAPRTLGEDVTAAAAAAEVLGRPLPGLRLRLRGGRRATSARASRPAPPGPTSPTTGAAPTAGCATRSTSSRCRRSAPDPTPTMGA